MQKVLVVANLLKVRKVMLEGITKFVIVTDNKNFGTDGSLIADSNVVYNSSADAGIPSAINLLSDLKSAKENGDELSPIFEAYSGHIVGELNSKFGGGTISINVVRYDAGDEIPLTKKEFNRIEEAGFVNKDGEPVNAYETENGKYVIVASRDWETVKVLDFTLQKSERVLFIEAMAEKASVSSIFNRGSNDISIFSKRKPDGKLAGKLAETEAEISEDENPFGDSTEDTTDEDKAETAKPKAETAKQKRERLAAEAKAKAEATK